MGKSNRTRAAMYGVVAASLVVALGAYAGAVSGGERGSFVMNFPAEGADAGGPSPRALTGSVVVSLDDQGFIKRYLQPNVIEVASHVVRNVGDTPRRIRFEVEGFTDEIEWHSRDRAWNPETHEIERDIAPDESVDFGLLMTVPDPLPSKSGALDGTIVITDAETGDRLSELPVTFLSTGIGSGGDCCE